MGSFVDCRHALCCRQLNGKGRSFAGLAIDGDPPVVSPHGFLHDGQPETCPPSGLLGGEKGLENLCRVIRFDSMSGIGDFNGHPAGLMQASAEGDGISQRCAQTERSAVGHGLKGIFYEMVERFLHVLAVRLDQWEVRGQFGDASHVLALAFGSEQTRALPQTVVDVDLLPHRRRTPGIQQQVLNDA